jgi:uncharacterized membrane protein YeaQ/YmgE (transglycosylase-associated protein family)
MGFFWMVVIGAAAGWMGGRFMKAHEYGVRVDIVIGVVGALVAALLLRMLGPSDGLGAVASVLVAAIGATTLLFAMRRFMTAQPVPIRRPRRR